MCRDVLFAGEKKKHDDIDEALIMTTRPDPDLEAEAIPTIVLGKDEMNLCELPIAKLGRRDKREVIKFIGEVVKDGKTIPQEWIVRGAGGLGLPTEFAERVLVALISLAATQGFPKKTHFTVYEILKLMGVSSSGFRYQEFTLALERLHGVAITSKSAWWDHRQKKYATVTEGFGLIDRFRFKVQDTDTDENCGGYVVWNEWVLENFWAGYIKHIDTDFYYGLEHTLTRRLYRFLDKRMHYQDRYQIDLFALAARLGMAEYKYPSKVREKLKPAFDELIARDYLREVEVFKVGKFTRVRFVRTGAYSIEQPRLWDDANNNTAEHATDGPHGTETAGEGTDDLSDPQARLTALYAEYDTPDTLKATWQAILQELSGTMPSGTFQMLADSALLAVDGDEAFIAVNAQNHDWIERQMRRKFCNLLRQHSGTTVKSIRLLALA